MQPEPNKPPPYSTAIQAELGLYTGPAVRVVAWPAGGGNPYNSQLYTHLSALGAEVVNFSPLTLLRSSEAIWHLHWPEWMLNRRSATAAGMRAAALLCLSYVARLRKTRVVWTVHNLNQHEHDHPWIEWWFWPAFIRQLSGFIVLSALGKELVEERHPRLRRIPGYVIPHGHYRGAYPDTVSRAEARAELRLAPEARVAAFVGQIRPYKNVPHLIDTFRQIPDQRAQLLIAGQPNEPATRELLLKAAGAEPRVHLSLEFVPETKLQIYLRAADLVVLPFSDILNSGSALLALSFDSPVLVPRIGALAELERELGTRWVRGYSGVLTSEVLAGALEEAHRQPPGRCEALNRFGWESLARKTWEAFHAIRGGRKRRQASTPGAGRCVTM